MKPPLLTAMLSIVAATLVLLALAAIARGDCRSHACWHRVHAERAWDVCVRRHGGNFCTWRKRYRALPEVERRWVRCIAYWETYGTPWSKKSRVVGTWGHLGSTQFDPDTAIKAGFTRRVTSTTLYEQLVRSVWWAHETSRSQWSTAWRCPA